MIQANHVKIELALFLHLFQYYVLHEQNEYLNPLKRQSERNRFNQINEISYGNICFIMIEII